MVEVVDEFLTEGYQRHNRRRQGHLASLGLDLQGKTVLEIGAGIGDHTGFFLDRGCTVVAIEGRRENAERLSARYPQVQVIRWDLDSAAFPLVSAQVVYAYGILYHLAFPAQAIRQMADACRGLLLLETCVYHRPGIVLTREPEDSRSLTGSLRGMACLPSRGWVKQELERYFDNVYLPLTQPDHEEFPLDWDRLSEALIPPEGLIRAVFVASRTPLENPLLTTSLPTVQEVCKHD